MRRLSDRRGLSRLALPAAVMGSGVVLGGVGGVIVGFFGLLLFIERMLDRLAGLTGGGRGEAERIYLRLARERRMEELRRRVQRRAPEDDALAYLAEDSGWAAVANRRPLGVVTIPTVSIVGTVDRKKAQSFDRTFRPPAWSRERWIQMCFAARRGTTLPPISVYRVGNQHYLRDGHHRVSVARALQADSIEAEVVELSR
jgi:hypothetical protein